VLIELGIVILVLIVSWVIGLLIRSKPEPELIRPPWKDHLVYFEKEKRRDEDE
jgi:hypothetical protein